MSSLRKNPHLEVLIPAAGPPPEGVLGLANVTCTAMVPVAGRPVIYWMLEYLHGLGLRHFRMAVPRRGLYVEDFVECAAPTGSQVEFLAPSRDGGLGLTLLELAEASTARSALVVLGDTHFRFEDPKLLASDDPWVLVHAVEESYRWCLAETDPGGMLTRLRDKEPGLEGNLQALIGVYYFPDLDRLRRLARQAVEAADQAGRRAQMADVLAALQAEAPVRVAPAAEWLDCGNPDRQADSHRSLLQMRAFNELSIDPVLGTLTKRSQHVAKLIDEINYLRLLPEDLAVLFPRLLASSTDWNDPWMTLEYYGYPSLSEIFVFENVDAGIWERVFQHLADILEQGFLQRRRPLEAQAVRRMYLTKTRRRLEECRGPQELRDLIDHPGPLEINGRPVHSLRQLWPVVEERVEALADGTEAAVMHGDLCLSNILYDLRSGIVKLLDPRGSFDAPGIYGDPRYDLAKLYHSVYGLYDFIVNDLFTVRVEGDRISLDIRSRPEHEEIRQRFEKVFFARFPREQVLFITALLFLSMPALHYDAPRRQLAMVVRGLELLDEAVAEGTLSGDTSPKPAQKEAVS
ncbi:MAG: hypothetical protein SX243_04740 [Acidobacteriota bacterium]|nr:hypothetical protein [Acidobacteriota bacterium]